MSASPLRCGCTASTACGKANTRVPARARCPLYNAPEALGEHLRSCDSGVGHAFAPRATRSVPFQKSRRAAGVPWAARLCTAVGSTASWGANSLLLSMPRSTFSHFAFLYLKLVL